MSRTSTAMPISPSVERDASRSHIGSGLERAAGPDENPARAVTACVATTAACILTAAALLAPPANAAPLPSVRLVAGPVASVAAHSVKDVFATCATGEVVVSGGYIQPNNTSQNGVALVNGVDVAGNRWFVRVKNDSETNLQIQAQAGCQAPASLRWVDGPTTSVASHAVKDLFAGCAPGETVMSGGYIQPGNTTLSGIVLVNGFDPSANRWFVRVTNDSGSTLQIRAQVACDTPTSTQQVNGPVASVAAHSVHDVFASCPAGHPRVGGGYIEPNNTTQNGIVLSNGFDSNASRWFVRVKNDSAATLPIHAQIRCQ